ncbi:MAG: ureidoglycolate lyase [Pseudomonadota bacterium]
MNSQSLAFEKKEKDSNSEPVDYLREPKHFPDLPIVTSPLIEASDDNLEGYGYTVADPENHSIEIMQWPAQGWRPVDAGTGDEGGVAEGVFEASWDGDVLMGKNDAVAGNYILGWSEQPQSAQRGRTVHARDSILLWHFNYHPDGGQLFFPMSKAPFVLPLALPGDDLTPEKVVTFWCDGSVGVYIHPSVWHEGVFPVTGAQTFLDRQGRVHARVSCNFAKEFGVYVCVPMLR